MNPDKSLYRFCVPRVRFDGQVFVAADILALRMGLRKAPVSWSGSPSVLRGISRTPVTLTKNVIEWTRE